MPGGRTRTFDVDVALDLAVELFWRQGYEGTSIADLTAAMGIAPPSLYAAFGNKRELFRAATDRYLESRRHYLDRALAEPTARLVARRFLIGTVEASTLPGRPQGCLTVQRLWPVATRLARSQPIWRNAAVGPGRRCRNDSSGGSTTAT
jgi:AcrR family transcriptional regulator